MLFGVILHEVTYETPEQKIERAVVENHKQWYITLRSRTAGCTRDLADEFEEERKTYTKILAFEHRWRKKKPENMTASEEHAFDRLLEQEARKAAIFTVQNSVYYGREAYENAVTDFVNQYGTELSREELARIGGPTVKEEGIGSVWARVREKSRNARFASDGDVPDGYSSWSSLHEEELGRLMEELDRQEEERRVKHGPPRG